MDLGLKGKRAIVCAASKGLGRGCAEALAREGVSLVITARGAEALERTAAEIRAATGVGGGGGGRRHRDRGRAAGGARCLPGAGHPGQQRGRPAGRAIFASSRTRTGCARSRPTC